MRDWVRRAVLGNRPWLLAGIGVGLGALAAAWLFASFSSLPTATPGPGTSASPTLAPAEPRAPGRAAASEEPDTPAPSDRAAVSATPEPSPFTGIAQVPAEPPHRSGTIHHAVTAGQVLWQIAEQYALRPETILWANDIDDPDLLLVGQELLIPPQDGVLYTVRPGDQLAEVAVRYGVEMEAVVSSNELDDANQIQAGIDLFLPGGRPLAAVSGAGSAAVAGGPDSDLSTAAAGPRVPLPDNIEALLAAGWLRAQHDAELYKAAERGSPRLHQVPGGARLERLDGLRGGRIQVRDPGDGRTRQAMTGWVDAVDLDVGRAPATRELPQAYPADTAMDIAHVFAPYRSQLDGAPYAEANCGPTAVGMVLDAFGVSVPLRQLRAAALEAQHMHGNGVGTLITALAQVVQQYGLTPLDLRDGSGGVRQWGLDDIREHVRLGHPVIVQVRYRSLPGRGGAYYFGDHYIVVTGVVGDGFLYNDPIDIDGLGWDRAISGAALRGAMSASDRRYAYSAFAVGR